MKSILLPLALMLACSCSGNDSTHAADNSSRNARDKSGETLTPMDQSGTEADLALTQRIRESLTDDDALSTNAKNVKVITQSGRVTLRGVVGSETERDAVVSKVSGIAGVLQCDDQLEVK